MIFDDDIVHLVQMDVSEIYTKIYKDNAKIQEIHHQNIINLVVQQFCRDSADVSRNNQQDEQQACPFGGTCPLGFHYIQWP